MKKLIILPLAIFFSVFTSCNKNETQKENDNKSTTLEIKNKNNDSDQHAIEDDTLLNTADLANKKIQLPFDYDKYIELCYMQDDANCDANFPSYKSDQLPLITKLINDKLNKNTPDRIYGIENSGLEFDTYVFMIKDEQEDYLSSVYVINVKRHKIIASQIISQSPDGEAPEDAIVPNQTFVINKDLSISVFDKVYKKENKLSGVYVVNPDGTIKAK